MEIKVLFFQYSFFVLFLDDHGLKSLKNNLSGSSMLYLYLLTKYNSSLDADIYVFGILVLNSSKNF